MLEVRGACIHVRVCKEEDKSQELTLPSHLRGLGSELRFRPVQGHLHPLDNSFLNTGFGCPSYTPQWSHCIEWAAFYSYLHLQGKAYGLQNWLLGPPGGSSALAQTFSCQSAVWLGSTALVSDRTGSVMAPIYLCCRTSRCLSSLSTSASYTVKKCLFNACFWKIIIWRMSVWVLVGLASQCLGATESTGHTCFLWDVCICMYGHNV